MSTAVNNVQTRNVDNINIQSTIKSLEVNDCVKLRFYSTVLQYYCHRKEDPLRKEKNAVVLG